MTANGAAHAKLVANSGVDIGDVDVTSVVPGVAAASLGKAEDAAHSSGDTGVMALAVRNDTLAALAGTDGDYAPLQVSAAGALHVTDASASGGANVYVDDADWTATSSSHNLIGGVYQSTPGTITDGDTGPLRVTQNGAAHVDPGGSAAVSSLNSQTLATSGGGANTVAYSARKNTVASSTSSTLVLDASASAADDTYNNLVVEILTGLGSGQARLITDYTGSSKTANISPDWHTAPDSTSEFTVHQNSGICQVNDQACPATSIKISSAASAVDDFYNKTFIKLLHGVSEPGQLREVTDYDVRTKSSR
jgi:hypothetical protein